ncbi:MULTISPECIES: putative Na+/H+ antiporter [unclassified Massilia]|uniref:putative Na+/H+ antiporter n=1 Tax=unclassified Massilia TaxID=2609279 RepID=UPI00178705E1|nr:MULTISPECIES: putative Na+/H+ antiporter [unclassified Massilia]MBD8528953.1 putative Na+/H+ antiporter [Massilia sp. CFBP 13647]MBD8673595.1 putative Na+/H+ antiporter [Massilia sp. CFBP 13721]
MTTIQLVGAILFACALIHTFAAKGFEILADRHPRHEGLFHLLGEVEVVFGFWAFILVVAMALVSGPSAAIDYAESRHYTEPLFVFVVMVIAASRPILYAVRALLGTIARLAPLRSEVALAWLGLALVPLAGSLITEPAAMTLAALMLAPQVFRPGIPEPLKYGALGVLFVNVSIGGTLTAYAAPPVLMVAGTWGWDSAYMLTHFGWRAAVAVLINASVVTVLLQKHLAPATTEAVVPVPLKVSLIHLAFLAAVVLLAHHPVLFLGLFLLFLGFTQAYGRHQDPLILKEGLLVGFFLAGLVVLGGMQQWWLQPIVSSLAPTALFFGALGLTAITDNAALTYLGSLIAGLSEHAKYMLVAGAVAGGGLTVIANAPNPAGAALLRRGFNDESIGALGLLAGALGPTIVAALLFLI